MKPFTANWVKLLLRAVIVAEEMDDYTILDPEYSRIEKDGRIYIGFAYDDILYLILTRLSMDETIEEE